MQSSAIAIQCRFASAGYMCNCKCSAGLQVQSLTGAKHANAKHKQHINIARVLKYHPKRRESPWLRMRHSTANAELQSKSELQKHCRQGSQMCKLQDKSALASPISIYVYFIIYILFDSAFFFLWVGRVILDFLEHPTYLGPGPLLVLQWC